MTTGTTTYCNNLHRPDKIIKKHYFEHLSAHFKLNIYKYNLATHTTNTGHQYSDTNSITITKHVQGTIINIRENICIKQRKTQNTLISKQIKTNDKYNTVFKLSLIHI